MDFLLPHLLQRKYEFMLLRSGSQVNGGVNLIIIMKNLAGWAGWKLGRIDSLVFAGAGIIL